MRSNVVDQLIPLWATMCTMTAIDDVEMTGKWKFTGNNMHSNENSSIRYVKLIIWNGDSFYLELFEEISSSWIEG